ncbi:hypothetical protein CYMTET_27569 [Cymbomonas tetramitiformis]|uniref:Uncharacterized protein n=1 Tax=Cymbomonas tetramitiformis TaxID=36881 RepID=A0AAE0KWS9_9CHLO|nr:hypothetical protein CYMTET_27569 [Cymbomonas tetramitiformis]
MWWRVGGGGGGEAVGGVLGWRWLRRNGVVLRGEAGKPHRPLVHIPLVTAMVLDNLLEGAAAKRLERGAVMQALATETAAKLGVQASVSDPRLAGVVDNFHKGAVAVGDMCVHQQFCLHRFVVDETTDQRDVDLPFYCIFLAPPPSG